MRTPGQRSSVKPVELRSSSINCVKESEGGRFVVRQKEYIHKSVTSPKAQTPLLSGNSPTVTDLWPDNTPA